MIAHGRVPAQVSARVRGGAVNDITRVRTAMAAAGVAVTDLSDSNPTRHGLLDPAVLEVVARHAADAAVYEPRPRGNVRAREALAAHYGGHPDDYWLTASTSQSYTLLLALLADPGDAVAIPLPGYPLVAPLARVSGVRTISYRSYYAHPHGWVPDLASLDEVSGDPAVRAVITVSPGNPTGAYLSGAVDDVTDACARRGIALVADEVFAAFALDGVASSVAAEARVPTFTLGGLSKLLCAPQLKLAWIRLSGPQDDLPALREALDTVADLFLPVSEPVAAALPELLGLADASVARTRRRLQTNLAAAHRLLEPALWRVRRCEGGWNVIVDAPPEAARSDLALHLLQRDRLAVHPGWFYDLTAPGALVISLLPAPDAFAAALAKLQAAVDRVAADEK